MCWKYNCTFQEQFRMPLIVRCLLWTVYGYCQGMNFFALWVDTHELGHRCISEWEVIKFLIVGLGRVKLRAIHLELHPFLSVVLSHVTSQYTRNSAITPSLSVGRWYNKLAYSLLLACSCFLMEGVSIACWLSGLCCLTHSLSSTLKAWPCVTP